MIVVETKLKKLPERCSKCKFKGYDSSFYTCNTICSITRKEIELKFDKEKKNWVSYRPKWCPLTEIN